MTLTLVNPALSRRVLCVTIAAIALASAGMPLAEAGAQLVSPKTVPVHQGQQFEIFPSDRAGMGYLSIAVDDTLLDPFVNPAKTLRVPGGWMQATPFTHTISGSRGGGRTLPLSGFASSGSWAAAGVFSLQELERANVAFDAPISDRRATNQYVMGTVARRLADGLSVGASAYWSDLGAVDGVDLLYAGSDRIRQSGRQTDLRLGLTKDWTNGRTFELVLLQNRYRMTHDVHYAAQWRWDPCCGGVPPRQFAERDEHNADRTNTLGAHVEFSQPVGTEGWRVGWLATANRHSHPKIPNYQIQNIPRDPGNTDAFNVGVGIARSARGTTFGIDLILEPMRSHTWADAATDTQAVNGGTIRAGQHTVDNHFRFSNTLMRVGFAHDFPAVSDSSTTFGFQAGLGLYSIKYELNQANYVTLVSRSQNESWMEWTPTFGFRYRTSDFEVSYAFSRTCGPQCDENRGQGFAMPAAPDGGGGPVIAAPSGPLDFDGGSVTRHRLMFSFRLK